MQILVRRLKDYGITVSLLSIERKGYYVPAWRTIFVKQELSEEEMKLVVLHELKHALSHEDYSYLYTHPVPKAKMEKEATVFMLNELIKEGGGIYNHTQMIEKFRLGIGNPFE